MGPPKRKLFFLHVQKTAGATVTGSIVNRFAEPESLLLYYSPEPDVSDLEPYRYVSGHVTLSFADRFTERPFVFTFLRDPVERALSAYSFYRTRPPEFEKQLLLFGRGPDAYARAGECLRLARECSLEELIERAPGIAAEYFGSRQARVLADADPEGGDEGLEDALDGLERCDFVGLSEWLDESMTQLTGRLGWRPLSPLPRINVTRDRLRREQVSSGAMEALRELTTVDRELYRRGVARYERQLAEWGHDPKSDPSVAVADPEPVADLPFDRPIPGGGWVGREQDADGASFCWIGGTSSAWVELEAERGANALEVEVAHAVHPSILEDIHLSVDGSRVPHSFAESRGRVVAAAPLRRRRLASRRVRVTIETDRTLRPCDLDPASSDDRELSVAVSRVALRRR
ncbi:MAG TPA: sulfotransferase family 2 domain-containing protein [Solirubrobacterales bacterium]|nr:sulfotransferase family 2 domain-containing protein [Solirubrobacterales bacterium]